MVGTETLSMARTNERSRGKQRTKPTIEIHNIIFPKEKYDQNIYKQLKERRIEIKWVKLDNTSKKRKWEKYI